MSQPGVNTSTPAMQQAAGHFENAVSSANSHLQQINSEMAALQATWKGEASTKFGQAMNDWEQQFDIIIKELIHMIEVMGSNAKVYTQTEESAFNTAGAWAGGLSGI